jgi:fibronectin type 3 domain-containing protein
LGHNYSGGKCTVCGHVGYLANVVINRTIPHTSGNILYWDAVDGSDIYQIYRLRSGETSWTLQKNTRSLGYKDETAVAGLKYYYKIVARNGDVKSDIKTTVSVGMVRPGAVVTKLSNVTIYKTVGHSSGNILYWNQVDGAIIYQVYRLENGKWVLLKNTGSFGYKDETAPVGVKCYYKIVARNGDIKSDIATTASASATRP